MYSLFKEYKILHIFIKANMLVSLCMVFFFLYLISFTRGIVKSNFMFTKLTYIDNNPLA